MGYNHDNSLFPAATRYYLRLQQNCHQADNEDNRIKSSLRTLKIEQSLATSKQVVKSVDESNNMINCGKCSILIKLLCIITQSSNS